MSISSLEFIGTAVMLSAEDFAIEMQVEREGVGTKTRVMVTSGEQAAVTAHQLPTSITEEPASTI